MHYVLLDSDNARRKRQNNLDFSVEFVHCNHPRQFLRDEVSETGLSGISVNGSGYSSNSVTMTVTDAEATGRVTAKSNGLKVSSVSALIGSAGLKLRP